MDLTTLNLSDLPHIVAYIGVVCGMVFHVWKKWRQAGAERLSFLTTLKNWFLEKLPVWIVIRVGISFLLRTLLET